MRSRFALLAALLAPLWARAEPGLPGPVRDGLFDRCLVAPARQAEFLSSLVMQSADLNGDGVAEHIIQLNRHNEDHDVCSQAVFSRTPTGYAAVFEFECCEYKVSAATKKRGGRIFCGDDAGRAGQVLTWQGRWPDFARPPTRREAQQQYEGALQRSKGGDHAAAVHALEKLLDVLPGRCLPPEYLLATVMEYLATDKRAEAMQAIGREAFPDEPLLELAAGRVWEARGDWSEAASRYQTYLKLSPHARDRAVIERKLADLARRRAAAAPR